MLPPLTDEWFWLWDIILKKELSKYHDEIRKEYFRKYYEGDCS